jgi:apolipoprotein D and lipocalin family protein
MLIRTPKPWLLSLVLTKALLAACPAPDIARADENLPEKSVTAVEFVDLDRYVGLWYEVARIPNRFQDHCARGTTAHYTLLEDGRIEVVNRCQKTDGKTDEAKGIARIEDTVSNAKLKVSFVSFLGWRPFWGDYWVIGLDPDYRWAVVGTPDRKYGWILARTPDLEGSVLAEVHTVLERNGYRPESFETSPR